MIKNYDYNKGKIKKYETPYDEMAFEYVAKNRNLKNTKQLLEKKIFLTIHEHLHMQKRIEFKKY